MILTARQFYREQHAKVAVYVTAGVNVGWVADTGVGGTFSWNADDAKWWDSEDAAISELVACDLLDPSVHHRSAIQTYVVVRVR